MLLNIRNIPEGHSSVQQTTMLEAVKDGLPPFSEAVQCRIQFDRSGSTIYVHVEFEGKFEMECSRCLEKFQAPVFGDVRVVMEETKEKHGRAIDSDMVDFYFDSHHDEIDISSAIFDEIMTALPLKPLCSPDCKGIAVNDPSIEVEFGDTKKEKAMDPRWEALLKLKRNDQ